MHENRKGDIAEKEGEMQSLEWKIEGATLSTIWRGRNKIFELRTWQEEERLVVGSKIDCALQVDLPLCKVIDMIIVEPFDDVTLREVCLLGREGERHYLLHRYSEYYQPLAEGSRLVIAFADTFLDLKKEGYWKLGFSTGLSTGGSKGKIKIYYEIVQNFKEEPK